MDTSALPILVVDDEAVIADELGELLDAMGYTPVIAYDVDQALSEVSRQPNLSVIISDMRMPIKDGATLVNALGQHPYRHFLVIITSGHMDVENDLCSYPNIQLKLMGKPLNVNGLEAFLAEHARTPTP
jgi:DNA-binding NtrC family response regulator